MKQKMNALKYVIVSGLFFLFACTKSQFESPIEKPLPDGMTRIKIQTNFAGFAKPTTRVEGIESNNIKLFLLDKNWDNVLTESATIDPATGVVDVILTVSGEETDTYRVAIIANPPAKFNNGTIDKEFGDITWGDISDYTVLKEKLNTLPIDEAGISGAEIPMTGISREYTKKQIEELTSPIEIDLTRMVAKVAVDSKVDNSIFEIEQISLCNAPKRGWFFSPTDYPAKMRNNAAELIDYAPVDVSALPTSPLYLYESRYQERTAVIVKAKYGGKSYFYRLEMGKDYLYTYKDIDGTEKKMTVKRGENYFLRNCQYTYTITAVSGRGYATLEDAKQGAASNNIIAKVDVTDLNSHDIVDNGEYYLGLTNSEYKIYADNSSAISGVVISTVTHNAPKFITATSIKTEGGITITSNPLTGVEFDGTPRGGEIVATLPAGFNSGSVTVTVGNLSKKITVRRANSLHFGANTIPDPAKEYVYGEIKNINGSWISLAIHEDFDNEGSQSLAVSEGGININMSQNLGSKTAIPDLGVRKADIYLSRRDANGRLKVTINQNFLDTDKIDDKEELLPFDLTVGAFWKKEQTGERLIRIVRPTSGEIDGFWFATIIQYGEGWDADRGDGIVMDMEMTKDANVGWRAGADENYVMNGNDPGFDKTHYVAQNKSVQGVLGSGDDGIYFRIGLQKPYTPTPAHPARYAVVMLAYTYKNGTASTLKPQRIFIRQGEDADYLYENSFKTKWSPYNLTDPTDPSNPASNALPDANNGLAQNNRNIYVTNPSANERSVGNGITAHWSVDEAMTAKMCDYPSQGGYFFTFKGRNSFNPIVYPTGDSRDNSLINVNNILNVEGERDVRDNKDYDDVCPQGYRTPRDHTDYKVAIDKGYSDTNPLMNASDSEVRTSLFPTPNGYDRPTDDTHEDPNSYMNQSKEGKGTIVGVYADGFMDRRQRYTPQNNGDKFVTKANSVTAIGTTKAAFIGRLMFNETTLASLFFPYSGSFAPSDNLWPDNGNLKNAPYYMGEHAVYGTSTNRKMYGTSIDVNGQFTNNSWWYLSGYQMIYIGYARDKNYVPRLVTIGPFTNFSLANIRCVKE